MTMNRRDLMLFALRAVNDWSMVPVLHDALLENASTRHELESKIAFAEKLAKTDRRNYFVVMLPRMLSPTWSSGGVIRGESRYDRGNRLFEVYEFDTRRHGSLADLIGGLEEQIHEPVVPVHGARAGGRR